MSRRRAHREAYAVVRVDSGFPFANSPGVGPEVRFGEYEVSIKEVVLNLEEAEREVDRLNELNGDKGCRYYWTGVRFFADGGSFVSGPTSD